MKLHGAMKIDEEGKVEFKGDFWKDIDNEKQKDLE